MSPVCPAKDNIAPELHDRCDQADIDYLVIWRDGPHVVEIMKMPVMVGRKPASLAAARSARLNVDLHVTDDQGLRGSCPKAFKCLLEWQSAWFMTKSIISGDDGIKIVFQTVCAQSDLPRDFSSICD